MAKPMMIALISALMIGVGMGAFQLGKSNAGTKMVLSKELPMEQAIREVEVSIWETANAVFYYMVDPQETALEEYKKQLKDVETFMAKYGDLIDSEEEKRIAAKFNGMWADVVKKAEKLIWARDQMTENQEKAWGAVHEVDDILDFNVQPAFIPGLPDLLEKEQAVREVEVSIWEAMSAVHYYAYRQFDKPKREYPGQLEDVEEFWGKYKKLQITPAEKPHLKKFDDAWAEAVQSMGDVFRHVDELKAEFLDFWEAVHVVDDIIDFEIQEHLKKRISQIQ